MIEFPNNVRLVESISELPNYVGSKIGFLDCETGSGDPSLDALNPWFHCFIAGIAITVDNDPWAYYIPVAHHGASGQRFNLPREAVIKWLTDVMGGWDCWVNQNIKYDMRVVELDFGIKFHGRVVDTLSQAKTYESDRLDNSIEQLSEDYLKHDIRYLKEGLAPHLQMAGNKKCKDYSRIPADVMAEYGGQDVLTVRRLWKFFTDTAYETRAFKIEEAVTPVLYDMETVGMRTTPRRLKAMNAIYMDRMIKIEKQIYEICGQYIRPHVNDDCHSLLCDQYNLPVLALTNEDDDEKESNPSFNKDAMKKYLVYPNSPVELIQLLIEYRRMNTFRNFFLVPYSKLNVDGVLHPSFTQVINTGRMACRSPNAQQLNGDAKKLIIPKDGCSFLSIDYSQIEFRLIAHYIRDQKTIDAYRKNPDTDFHQWVADLCGIPRKPAKNVNFCMGYGGGQKKLVEMLVSNFDLMSSIKAEVDALHLDQERAENLFNQKAHRRAMDVYHGYHDALPGLKPTAREATRRARNRGWVKNLIGRRRYLGRKRAHIAFNALNQSSAADIMKERLPFIQQVAEGMGVELVTVVHDEVLFQGPTEIINQDRTVRALIEVMETPDVPVDLPIRCSWGRSDKTWKNCGDQENTWPLADSPWISA